MVKKRQKFIHSLKKWSLLPSVSRTWKPSVSDYIVILVHKSSICLNSSVYLTSQCHKDRLQADGCLMQIFLWLLFNESNNQNMETIIFRLLRSTVCRLHGIDIDISCDQATFFWSLICSCTNMIALILNNTTHCITASNLNSNNTECWSEFYFSSRYYMFFRCYAMFWKFLVLLYLFHEWRVKPLQRYSLNVSWLWQQNRLLKSSGVCMMHSDHLIGIYFGSN